MSARGSGLFDSDDHLDMVIAFDRLADIPQLEQAAKARAKEDPAFKKAFSCKPDPRSKMGSDRIYFSILARNCSSEGAVALVRDYLDNGVLVDMINSLEASSEDGETDYSRFEYQYVLLGACAMTLGCTLPLSFKDGLKAKYKRVGLMHDALKQMQRALYGLQGFEDGVPHVFESPLGMRCSDPEQDKPEPGDVLLDVKSPESFPSDFSLEPEPKQVLVGTNVCGWCGAHYSEVGGQLLECGKCRKQKYCGRDCQRQHWKQHKVACKSAGA